MATLYRKYRSQTFEEVIGQQPIVTTLTNQIKLGRIGHAYLFTGSRGVGKTTCARIFARAVNCLHPVNGSPCGECEVCKRLSSDNVDIIEMDAASNNGVDDARDIREKVKYLPVSGKYKVYIIDEVHMLTGGAFNALLKTIEEPPEHIIFILATTEPQKLPQTILSRCIRFDFRLVPMDILADHIAAIYDKEGIKYTRAAVEEIARLGEGSVRDALSVADTLASAAQTVTEEVVLSLTGAGERAAVTELFDRTADCDLAGVLAAVDKLVLGGKSIPTVTGQLIDYTRNVLVVKTVGRQKAASGSLVNVDRATFESIAASAEKYKMQDVARILEELGAAENGLKYSVNPRVFMETALVKLICGAQREQDILRRLAALENSANCAEQKKNKVNYTPPQEVAACSAERQGAITAEKSGCGVKPVAVAFEPIAPPVAVAEHKQHDNSPMMPSDNALQKQQPKPAPDAPHNRAAEFDCPPIDDCDVPPAQEYVPPPPPDYSTRPKPVKTEIARADEGEFFHTRAEAESGLELLGKIVRQLRRATPPATRVMRLLAAGVCVKERDDAIAFVVPEDIFLHMSDRAVTDVLAVALKAIGMNKPLRIERTEDDLLHMDIERAKALFGRDAVTV